MNREFLKSILHYDPQTGIWTWLHRPLARVQWNGRFAGKRAGSIDPDTGYWRIRIDDVLYYAHRLAFVYVLGHWPAHEVDHENLDRADCRWDNLREATHAQNNANKNARSDSVSGLKGTWQDGRSGLWTAELRVEKKRYRKYGFKSAEEAHAAYVEMSKLHHGEFGRAA